MASRLDDAFKKKVSKHEAGVARVGGRFVPLVVSTTGVWNGDSLRELRVLSRIVAARTGRLEEEHWKETLAELSCSLARGNGQILAAVRHYVTHEADREDQDDPSPKGNPD